MRKTTKLFAFLLCAAMLLGAVPMTVSAADTTTQMEYDAGANGSNSINVTDVSKDSFKMTLKDGAYESGLGWNVNVDVNKTPYWIVHIKSMQEENFAKVIFIVNDTFITSTVLADRWAVVDLTPFANSNGVFFGKLEIFYQDYNFAKGTGSRSVTQIGGMWLSSSASLSGKVAAKKVLKNANFKKVNTGKTVAKYSDFVFDPYIKSEKVTDTSFAMWVDPDQELESYKWYGFGQWYLCIDINKVPYLYVNLAENETAYSLLVHVLDSAGRTMNAKNYSYVTAGHSGWQIYDIKSDLAELNAEYTGKMYLAVCINVDDGSSASGAQNYIKDVFFDTKFNSKPAGNNDTTSKKPTPASQIESADETESSEALTDNSSAADETESGAAESYAGTSSAAAGTSDEPKANNTWVYILIAIVIVLAGAGIGVFFLIKKKKAA